jgi:hypothetical protein
MASDPEPVTGDLFSNPPKVAGLLFSLRSHRTGAEEGQRELRVGQRPNDTHFIYVGIAIVNEIWF